MQFPVLQNISGTNAAFFITDSIPFAVLPHDLHGIGVDIHSIGLPCPQKQGSNGKYPAPAADIKDPVLLFQYTFHQLHAELGRFMRTRTENMPRVDIQHSLARRRVQFLPRGLDNQPFPNRERHKIFLPVIRPVFFLNVFHRHLQRAKFYAGFLFCCLCRRKRAANLRKLFPAVKVVPQKKCYPCFLFLLFLHQLICDIIPFAVWVFQKFSEIRFIVYHQPRQPALIQHACRRLQPFLAGRNKYFYPFHIGNTPSFSG